MKFHKMYIKSIYGLIFLAILIFIALPVAIFGPKPISETFTNDILEVSFVYMGDLKYVTFTDINASCAYAILDVRRRMPLVLVFSYGEIIVGNKTIKLEDISDIVVMRKYLTGHGHCVTPNGYLSNMN